MTGSVGAIGLVLGVVWLLAAPDESSDDTTGGVVGRPRSHRRSASLLTSKGASKRMCSTRNVARRLSAVCASARHATAVHEAIAMTAPECDRVDKVGEMSHALRPTA